MPEPTRCICYGGAFDGLELRLCASVTKPLGIYSPYSRTTYVLTGFKTDHACLCLESTEAVDEPPAGLKGDVEAYWSSHAETGSTGTAMIGLGTI